VSLKAVMGTGKLRLEQSLALYLQLFFNSNYSSKQMEGETICPFILNRVTAQLKGVNYEW
jgi:hypothetical protein